MKVSLKKVKRKSSKLFFKNKRICKILALVMLLSGVAIWNMEFPIEKLLLFSKEDLQIEEEKE
ncbi:hypothetical protein [Fusobacterium sp. PH5-44]|uniref:hypothetical protein n=1 Tax=unclassified Fusobacterium TaxID=2648384 RepID=UPI003D219EFE